MNNFVGRVFVLFGVWYFELFFIVRGFFFFIRGKFRWKKVNVFRVKFKS